MTSRQRILATLNSLLLLLFGVLSDMACGIGSSSLGSRVFAYIVSVNDIYFLAKRWVFYCLLLRFFFLSFFLSALYVCFFPFSRWVILIIAVS